MVDINLIEEAIELSREIKILEAKKKKCTEALKKQMVSDGVDSLNHNGSKVQLVEYSRMSVKKNMKDALLLFLKSKNLGSCISLNPDINKENLETEINLGNVTQTELDNFINVSNVMSIKVTV